MCKKLIEKKLYKHNFKSNCNKFNATSIQTERLSVNLHYKLKKTVLKIAQNAIQMIPYSISRNFVLKSRSRWYALNKTDRQYVCYRTELLWLNFGLERRAIDCEKCSKTLRWRTHVSLSRIENHAWNSM